MNIPLMVLWIPLSLVVVGCVAPTSQRAAPASTWRLQPPLEARIALQIHVQDIRPAIEREKKPSSEFLYSGSVFAVEENAPTIASDLGRMTVKFGGAENVKVVDTVGTAGPAIILTLNHWYSRTLLKPEKSPLFVNSVFGGTVTLQLDGKVMASRKVEANGTPSVVDLYIVFEREKLETPRLLAKAMEQSANSSQQRGYAQIMNFLQDHWAALQASK